VFGLKSPNCLLSSWGQNIAPRRAFMQTLLVRSVTAGHYLQIQSWELWGLKQICRPAKTSLCNEEQMTALLMCHMWPRGRARKRAACVALFSQITSLSLEMAILSYFPHVADAVDLVVCQHRRGMKEMSALVRHELQANTFSQFIFLPI
jgi:hypothetical protein